jgi:hypothetical protein
MTKLKKHIRTGITRFNEYEKFVNWTVTLSAAFCSVYSVVHCGFY